MHSRKTTPVVLAAFLAVLLTGSAALAAIAHNLSGTWDFAVITENGTGTPTVTLKQDGLKLSGTYESRMLGVRALTGRVKGDSLSFDLAPGGDANIVLSFSGVIVDADHLKGTVDFGGQGGATFTGTRKK